MLELGKVYCAHSHYFVYCVVVGSVEEKS